MIKLISFLIPFLKELVFGRRIDIQKEQSLRKKFTFFLIIGLITFSFYTSKRLYLVSSNYNTAIKKLVSQEALVSKIEKLEAENKILSVPKPVCKTLIKKPR